MLPRIHILATGGTIAGLPNQTGGYQAGKLSVEDLIAGLPSLAALARLSVHRVASIGSQDMDDALWLTLARAAQAAADRDDLDGIVITHGTDTMEETAYFLSLVVRTRKPIVLVGAMRPATALSADGPGNLFNAIAVAAHPESAGRGVLVVADDEIHFAREVAKTNTTQVGTFRSTARGLAGLVHQGRLHLYAPPARQHTHASPFAIAALTHLPRVDIVYAHAGMDAALIQAAVAAGAQGLVLAGMGHGNIAARTVPALTAAIGAGIAVVRSTRTGGGVVERNVELDDDRLGFIAAEELNPAKARVLLQLGLTQTRDPRTLQTLFHSC